MLYPVSLQYSIFANIQVTILYLLNTESYTYVILSRVVLSFPTIIESWFISAHCNISLAVLSYVMISALKLKVSFRARSTLLWSWKHEEVWIKLFMTLWVSVRQDLSKYLKDVKCTLTSTAYYKCHTSLHNKQ